MKQLFAYETTRRKVRRAFAALREQGIKAKENHLCCTTCATDDMSPVGRRGGVYWHGQNDDNFREDGELYIGFFTDSGKGSDVVAKKLVDALHSERLVVEWNGDTGTKVLVRSKKKEKRERY